MKIKLDKFNYCSYYDSLVVKYNLLNKNLDWSDLISETDWYELILNTDWLANIYTKQSLKRFAAWCYKKYYNLMHYLIRLKERSFKHSDN